MADVCHIDFETRSTVPLPKTGVYVYAEHPTTEIWLMAWAFNQEEPELWFPGQPLPQRIVDHARAGGEFRAHNAQFERVMWKAIMVPRYGAPPTTMEQWFCSAAEAAAMSLPRTLEQLTKVLGVKAQKDKEGHALMQRMCRPRSIEDDGTIIWWDVPEKINRLGTYCKQDVRSEQAVEPALRRLSPDEREIYLLNQRMCDRGIHVDLPLVQAAKLIADEGTRRADMRLDSLTNSAVDGIMNHKSLLAWLKNQDIETDSVAKPAIAALLERDDLATNVQEVLALRADAGRNSLAKLDAMLLCACADSMLRGMLLYHAASTGREAGKNVQPQNFPRGELPFDVESMIPLVMEGDYDKLDLFAHPIIIVLSMLRSMIDAEPGHRLMAGDFSAVEARVLNWLAGQEDILDLFRAMDAGDKSKHPYKVMAVKMGRGASPADIKKPSEDYQAGKAAELGCGFGMGADKFVSAAWTVYQVRVTKPQSKVAVDAYRATHPMVKQYWTDTEAACINAVENPGVPHKFGPRKNCTAVVAGAYLYIKLPSGRFLCFPSPTVEDRMTPWKEMKPALHWWSVHQKTRKWCKQNGYGGLLVENIVQAVARDLMLHAALRLEKAGYIPRLNVHDETVTQVPIGFGTLEEFARIMSEVPPWATGCPIAVEVWEGARYRK